MVLFALISAACGALLGPWLKVMVLVPASLLVWGFALVLAWMQGQSFLFGLATAALFATCLQLGYLVGATLAGFADAYLKRVMAVH